MLIVKLNKSSGKIYCLSSCFLLFLLIFNSLYAQDRYIDSLKNLIKNDKEDTAKVNHLYLLGRRHEHIPDVAFEYYNQALALAKKLDYPNSVAEGYKNIGHVYWTVIKDNPKALDYFSRAEKIYDSSGNKIELARVSSFKGLLYYGIDSFSKSLDYDFKALRIIESTKDIRQKAAISNGIANTYRALGDYAIALKYYTEALTIVQQLEDEKRIESYLNNLGIIYIQTGDYPNAMNYFNKALEIAEKSGDKAYQSIVLNGIAELFKSEKKYSDALEYDLKALKIGKDLKSWFYIGANLEGIGEIYKEEGDYQRALEYEIAGLDTSEMHHYMNGIINGNITTGEIYLGLKKFKEAEAYLQDANKEVRNSHQPEMEKECELELSKLYTATGDIKKSFLCFERYDSLKDTLYNREKIKEITKIEAKAEFDKQLATEKSDEEKLKQQSESEDKHEKFIILVVTLIAVIVGLLAALIYRTLRLTRKQKLLAEKEKIIMELKALRAQMNPHFIFNAINSIQTLMLDNNIDSARKHLSRFSKLIRMVLEYSSYENIMLSDEIKMLELYLEIEAVRFSSKFSYEISVNNDIDIENSFIPPLIIQPYVENAIWHGLMHLQDKQGLVRIQFEKNGSRLKCIVDDNGIGRRRSRELKDSSIYKPMGLSITAERLEIMNTLLKSKMSVTFTDKINADSTSAGTKVELLIPVIINSKNHA